jgi:hypothetical protein
MKRNNDENTTDVYLLSLLLYICLYDMLHKKKVRPKKGYFSSACQYVKEPFSLKVS